MEKDTKKQVAAVAGVAGAAGIGAAAAAAATTVGQSGDSMTDTNEGEENPAESAAEKNSGHVKASGTTKVAHETEIVIDNNADEPFKSTTLEEARAILEEETSKEAILNPPISFRPEPIGPPEPMYAAPMDPNGWEDPYSGEPCATDPYAVDPYAVNPYRPLDIYGPAYPGETEEPSPIIEDVYAGPMPPEVYDPELPEDPASYGNPDNVYEAPFE